MGLHGFCYELLSARISNGYQCKAKMEIILQENRGNNNDNNINNNSNNNNSNNNNNNNNNNDNNNINNNNNNRKTRLLKFKTFRSKIFLSLTEEDFRSKRLEF